jgi:hypothetical protein
MVLQIAQPSHRDTRLYPTTLKWKNRDMVPNVLSGIQLNADQVQVCRFLAGCNIGACSCPVVSTGDFMIVEQLAALREEVAAMRAKLQERS